MEKLNITLIINGTNIIWINLFQLIFIVGNLHRIIIKIWIRINYLITKKSEASIYFKEFLDFAKLKNFDNNVIYESINNNDENKANYKLLFGIPEEVVPRAILEAKRYQKAFAIDKEISNNFKDYEIT